jgi:two-component system OmpR family response regulator
MARRTRSFRILVVDDQPSYRTILKDLLELEDFEVATASRARDAVALAAHFRPDVLVVDLMLTGDRNGLELAAALQSDHPELQTILITGVAGGELQSVLGERPVSRVLMKPFEFGSLLAAVDQVVTARP